MQNKYQICGGLNKVILLYISVNSAGISTNQIRFEISSALQLFECLQKMVGVRKYLDNHSDDIQNCWRPADPEASILSLPSGRNKRACKTTLNVYMALAR